MSQYIKLEVWIPSHMLMSNDEDDKYREAISLVEETLAKGDSTMRCAIVSER